MKYIQISLEGREVYPANKRSEVMREVPPAACNAMLKSTLILLLYLSLLFLVQLFASKLSNTYFVLLLGFISGIIYSLIWHIITIRFLKLDGHQYVNGYHLHHSLLVIPVLLLLIINIHNTSIILFWILFSIGILTEHTLDEKRLVFIEKSSFPKTEIKDEN